MGCSAYLAQIETVCTLSIRTRMDSLVFYPILLELVGADPETRGGVLKHQNLQQFMGEMTKDHSWSSLL